LAIVLLPHDEKPSMAMVIFFIVGISDCFFGGEFSEFS